jgi:hypothetical protein
MTILFKPVLPRLLKKEVFLQEYERAMRRVARSMENRLKRTIRTWQGSKPSFETIFDFDINRGELSMFTGPTGDAHGVEKWVWLDEGTKDHFVRPVRAKALRFRNVYRAKTSPGVLGSSGGGSSGDFVFSQGHKVSGIEPRGWTQIAAKRFQPVLEKALDRANKIAVKKSGHAL